MTVMQPNETDEISQTCQIRLIRTSNPHINPKFNKVSVKGFAGKVEFAFKILNKMHELGVYHHDLVVSNLLWDGKSVTVIDFENATFRRDGEGSMNGSSWTREN